MSRCAVERECRRLRASVTVNRQERFRHTRIVVSVRRLLFDVWMVDESLKIRSTGWYNNHSKVPLRSAAYIKIGPACVCVCMYVPCLVSMHPVSLPFLHVCLCVVTISLPFPLLFDCALCQVGRHSPNKYICITASRHLFALLTPP